MHLTRMDCANDPLVGAVLCTFPSGAQKTAQWRLVAGEHTDPVALAKKATAALIDHLMACGLVDDLERTNITSAVAGIAAIVRAHQAAIREVRVTH